MASHPSKRSIEDAAGDVAGQARDTSDELAAELSDVAFTGQRLAAQGGRSVERQVRERPLEALLLASAIGYLIGWASSLR